jgi:hypothetical protein
VVNSGGVAMGSRLPPGAQPRFVLYALKDETDLAQVDWVKASVVGGKAVERIYSTPLTGAPYCITWADPNFDASSPAFYYARVLEKPSPRWSHYDCDRLKASRPDWQTVAPGCASTDPATGLDINIQERAWTSPIYYFPQ